MTTGIHANAHREALLSSLALLSPEWEASNDTVSALEEQLADQINFLVEKDFSRLLNLLYRIDVSEEKIKKALLNNSDPAGYVIARLIIERQLQKIAFRKKFTNGEGEKW